MTDPRDVRRRAEGLAPVHYLFGAGPSAPAEVHDPAVPPVGSEEPDAAEPRTDGARWFDPAKDGEEGLLGGTAQRAMARGRAGQAGERSIRSLRSDDGRSDDEHGAEPGTGDGCRVPPHDRERDEERRRLREERAAERAARRAENVTMHALTRRGQSVQEIRDLLAARELDVEEIEAEIERLSGVGLLDDADLAENLVRTLTERKKLGRSALVSALRRRKLDPIVIEQALAELDRDDEEERCLELARQRARQLNSVDEQTAERRLSAFLQRKGYSGDAIRTSVRTALRDERGVRFV